MQIQTFHFPRFIQQLFALTTIYFFFAWAISIELLSINHSFLPLDISSLFFAPLEHLSFALGTAFLVLCLSRLKIPLALVLLLSFSIGLLLIVDRVFYLIFFDHLSFSAVESGTHLGQLWGSFYDEIQTIDFISLIVWLLLHYAIALILNKDSQFSFGLPKQLSYKSISTIFISLIVLAVFQFFFASGNLYQNPYFQLAKEALESTSTPGQQPSINSETKLDSLGKVYQPIYTKKQVNRIPAEFHSNAQGKNVVLVVLESIGSLQLFPNGSIDANITPFLAKMRDKTTLFDSIYTYYPATTRAHVPLQTGGTSISYATTKQLRFPYKAPTLASTLKQAQYRTALFSAQMLNFGNLDRFYQQMNFDEYFDPDFDKKFLKKNKIHSWGVFDTAVIPKTMNWLDKEPGKPFLLQFFTASSHHPYGYPGSSKERNKLSRIERYAKTLRYTDQILENLWQELEQRNLTDNTIVYVVGDHGQAFGKRHAKNFTHRNYIYEENIKSFLLRIDNTQQQEVIVRRSGSMGDITPTIVNDVLKSKAPTNWLGQDLYAQNYQARMQFFHKHQKPMQWGLIDGNWKYISQQADSKQAELYDLSQDPTEQNNLATQYPHRIEQYQQRIANWSALMQQRFDQQLNTESSLLSLSANELSQKGAKKLRLGLRIKGQFIEYQAFHPDEDISSQIYRIPDGKTHLYRYTWLSPDGKTIKREKKINADWDRVYHDLDYPRSMQEGEWHLTMKSDNDQVLTTHFQVSKKEKLLDPRFRAMGPRELEVLTENKQGELISQEKFHPAEKIILKGKGIAYFRNTDIDIYWISPKGKTFKQVYTAKAKQPQWLIDAENKYPFEIGQWQIQIKHKNTLLAKRSFTIGANASLLNPQYLKETPAQLPEHLKIETTKPLTGIIIIDDQINKAHMQAYGYLRDNMPLVQQQLEKKQWIRFDKFYNEARKKSLHPALMHYQGMTPDNYNLIDLLNALKINTVWIDDSERLQEQFFSYRSKRLIQIDKHLPIDVFLENLSDLIAQSPKRSQLVVLYLSKNNSCLNQPYLQTLLEGKFGRFANTKKLTQLVNCHDNHAKYIDDLLAKLIENPLLQQQNSFVSYLSEYTPHIFEKTGHNRENLSNQIRDLPLLSWFSKSYQQQFPQIIEQLKQHRSEPYPVQQYFNTLLSLYTIQSTVQNPLMNLTSPLFNATMPRLQKANDETLSKYYQQDNLNHIIAEKMNHHILPHRNNSFGKIEQVLHHGLDAFEIDIVFNEKAGFFEVGHDDATMSAVKLMDILKIVPSYVKKIWFDVKNITPENIDAIIVRLNELNKIYPIKTQGIVESPITSDAFRKIAEQGFYTSHYLPTIKFKRLSKQKNHKALKQLAKDIIARVKRQDVKAISFDSKLYDFVKKDIEPYLWKKLDYHTWDMKLQSRDKDFIPTLYSMDYFYDQRVKTILYAFYTEFTL